MTTNTFHFLFELFLILLSGVLGSVTLWLNYALHTKHVGYRESEQQRLTAESALEQYQRDYKYLDDLYVNNKRDNSKLVRITTLISEASDLLADKPHP